MLTHAFHVAVQRLPVKYAPHAYHSIIEHFGTHYVQQGTLGGRVKYNYVMNKEDLKQSYKSSKTVDQCLSVELSAKLDTPFGSEPLESIGFSMCHEQSNSVSTSNHTSSFATATIVENIGGTSSAALAFTGGKINRTQQQDFWNGIRQNPGFLTKSLGTICSLIPYTTVNNATIIQSNCERALLEYLGNQSTIACDPCMNDGKQVNTNGTCSCACPEGTLGDRCEVLEGIVLYD